MCKSILVEVSLILFITNLFGQGVWEPSSDFEIRGSPTFIDFGDPYEGLVYLTRDGLVNTQDEGQSWSEPSLGELSMPSLEFLNFDTGWVGSLGELYYTIDGGDNWEEGEYDVASILDICFVNGQTGWTTGFTLGIGIPEDRPESWGSISMTSDGGQSWEIQYSERDGGLGQICFADEENGIASYAANSLLLT